MNCSDELLLQRLLDGDLDETQAELVSHHIESCAECHAAVTKTAALRSYVEDHLGMEDDGEQDSTAASLARIQQRVAGEAHSPSWRLPLLAVMAMAIFVLLPLFFVRTVSAFPERILEKASASERMWKYQPNKTLYWEVNSISRGVKNVADGKWRTLFWQKNDTTNLAQVSAQFDPQGNINHAYWQQADGTFIRYRTKERDLEISPSPDLARHALPALPSDLRAALNSYLSRREAIRSLQFNRHRDADWLHRPSHHGGSATVQRQAVEGLGDVYHITVVTGRPELNPEITRAVHEYDIEPVTFRLLRLRSTISYADGTAGVHDSH